MGARVMLPLPKQRQAVFAHPARTSRDERSCSDLELACGIAAAAGRLLLPLLACSIQGAQVRRVRPCQQG